ncbi:MAG: hypothetical protein F6K65_17380 [Moorea sp. SIO3C2]|nr:hypothetical protein [Moorena sp. SIO3C2]
MSALDWDIESAPQIANREQIDTYLALEEEEFDAMPQPLQSTDPSLYNKLISRLAKKQSLGE